MDKYFVFQDESNRVGDEIFFTSALILNKTNALKAYKIIAGIRNKFNFNNEMHFQKISKLKYKVYKEVMEETLRNVPFTTCTLLVRRNHLDMKYFNNQKYLAYNYFTRMVIYHNIKNLSGQVYIYPDYRKRVTKDNFVNYLRAELNNDALSNDHKYFVRVVEPKDSHSDELLQLTDLFLGVVKQKYLPSSGKWKTNLKDEIFTFKPYCKKINIWDWQPNKK